MGDDEGIIDLNALASTPPKVGTRSVAPLFMSEPPPAAFTADVGDSGFGAPVSMGGLRLGKRAIAGVAAAAVAVVLCSIGLAAAFKGEEPVARSAATMIVAPPALVAPAPAPEPTPAPVAASSSDDDAKSPTVGAGGKKQKGGKKGAAKASFASTKVQSSGVPVSGTGVAKTVPKASDKCGCKGNFDCILRCTATGK